LRNALVPVSSTDPVDAGGRAARRPNADFIAQLIAAAIKAPQTCLRRRATPGEAIALYRAAEHLPAVPRAAFSRSL
jgi:hypothetical protein